MANGQARRAKGEGRRAKGEGRRAKGEGRRAKGEGRRGKGGGRKALNPPLPLIHESSIHAFAGLSIPSGALHFAFALRLKSSPRSHKRHDRSVSLQVLRG